MLAKIKELNELSTDSARLEFCKKYNKDFYISLDNDSSHIYLLTDYDNWDDDKIEQFEEYSELIDWKNSSFDKDFGSRDGIPLLFKMLNISAQFC